MAKLADCPVPRTQAYVASLPHGLLSYPDTQVKGSAIAAVLKNLPEGMELARFPDELREMLDHPPPVSAWVPEVPFVALMLALCELAFDSDEAFLAWAESGFKGYFSASLYRILFAVLSPMRLAKGADKKWGALRRGSRREMIEATDDFNRGRVHYPRNAFPLVYVKLLCKGLTYTKGKALRG